MSTHLRSDFDLKPIASGGRVVVPMPKRVRLAWWEDAPKLLPERMIPEEERWRRRQRWNARHRTPEPKRCGDVWPKISIR